MTKPIRVAFSGAGFRIPAHCGSLFAIADAGREPTQVIGTSAGSIIGALLACGMSLDDMKTLALTHDWSNIMSWSPMAIFNKGFSSGNNLLAFLTEHTGGKKFSDISLDFSAVASNLSTNSKFMFSKTSTPDTPIALAVRASASIPFVFSPVDFNGQIMQDGGMVSNIAADSLVIDDVPRLGVQLVSQDVPLKPNVKLGVVALAMRIIDLMLSACETAHVTAAQQAGATMVFCETGYAGTLDRNMPLAIRQRLFNDGYASTAAALKAIIRSGMPA
jgi:NTE family protein